MIRANIAAAKNGFSALIRKVKAGETVLILDRDRPVAQITAVSDQFSPELLEFAQSGKIRLPLKSDPYQGPSVSIRGKGSLVDAVLADRKEGW